MKRGTANWHVVAMGVTALAFVMAHGSNAFAQSATDQARQARIAELKAKIAGLQDQLKKAQSEGHNSGTATTNEASTKNTGDCCAGGASGKTSSTNANHDPAGEMAQAEGGGSPGGEHPMGQGMGGGGMGGGMMGASPQASPGMPMQEHMKGMEHMHGMMHEGQASPGASPGAMEHGMPMEHPMGGTGGGGMGGEGMQGGSTGSSPQPQASPGAGMGGMHDM